MIKKSRLFLVACLCLILTSCTNRNHSASTKPTKEITLSIIKPNAVEGNHIGDIIAIFEKSGIRIAGIKMVHLTPKQAREFYSEHKERSFFNDLIEFMSSGPVTVMVLEGDDVIARNRELMGPTDPRRAAEGTIRKLFAESISANAIHGSDSPESAQREINFFFNPDEIHPRFAR